MILNRPITGRTVLYAMLGFFGVIFAVNGAFLYFALSSWPGLSTDHAYEKGVKYNQTLDDANAQKVVGWQSHVMVTDGQRITVSITDQEGAAVRGLEMGGQLIRPARTGVDQQLVLIEDQPGQYKGSASNLLAGQWRLEISAMQNGKRVYYKVHDLSVPE